MHIISKTQTLELPIRRIAILRALFLGDLLCSVPALRVLRQRFPSAEITLIGLPWAADLVARLPYLDRLAVFPGYPGIVEAPYQPTRTTAFLAEARAAGYDLAIQMHGSGQISNAFVAALGAKGSIGYRPGPDSRLSASLRYDSQEHEIVRWLRLVEQLQIVKGQWQIALGQEQSTSSYLHSAALEFPITAVERARAAELLFTPSQVPMIGIHAGASTPLRRWPAARFAALADALIERYGANIVLTGTANERPVTVAIRRAMHHPALDLAGETNLGIFGAAIAQLDLLVCNDTGAAHMAAAVGTPSVVIFGPGRPAQWGPLDRERHRVVDAWALAKFAADGVTALRELPVEPVLAACSAMLQPTAEPRRSLANNGTQAIELGVSSSRHGGVGAAKPPSR
jgi:ADP-heptose:LPS heptosyltransferase